MPPSRIFTLEKLSELAEALLVFSGTIEVMGEELTTAEERDALLDRTRTIAVIGVSSDPARASNDVSAYLLEHSGFELYFVNPRETELLGRPAYASLADVPVVPDMVDVFRRSEQLSAVVDEAIADETTHDEVRAEHERVVKAQGFGVPTLFFPEFLNGQGEPECFFGPVVIDPPTGDAALRLWDATVAWLEFPNLFELQRPKNGAHGAVIADSFRPYLEARDWVSIDRGEVVDLNTGKRTKAT